MRVLTKKMTQKRLLYIQLLFTALAFFMMVVLSYFFMRNIVLDHLVKNTENMLTFEQAQIESAMLESRVTLDGFSLTVRNMIIRGDDANKLRDYINDISRIRLSWQHISNFRGLYGYFETLPDGPALISGIHSTPSDVINPRHLPWYWRAFTANGDIVETLPYKERTTDELILSFSRVIFDDEGRRLGAVCLDMQIDEIGKNVVDMALSLGGYGMLFSQYFEVVTHHNQDYVGKYIRDLQPTVAALEEKLRSGMEISEYPVISYKGEPAVAFFRKLPNNWYLGVVVPKGPYYQSVTNVIYILSVLGLILAVILMVILIRVDTAKKKLVEESRHKSAFLANMSHEIRTPMNVILGITEMQLHDETLPQNMKEAFNKIYNSGDLLLNIINDILDMSKIEAGKMELAPAKYKITSLINDTTSLNMMRFGNKPIGFELSLDENMPSTMVGDELRIKQILNNLLSNSFKYTDQGKVKLTVTAITDGKESMESDVMLVLTVSDTGKGMTEKDVSKLFDEYTRFNMDANRTTEGTGLGMSITRNLVRMMNGTISVDSEPDKGTIFTVRLPQKSTGEGRIGKELADRLQNFRVNGVQRIERAKIVFEPMPDGRILVVDDMETNLYVAKGLLAPYRLKVATVKSGFDAIDKIKEGCEYDIVFMDHMMPKMDGIEATKIIRELGYTRPIVALTANAMSGQADMFLENGFDDFISKPIDIRQLNSVLKKFVRDRQPPKVSKAVQQLNSDHKEELKNSVAMPLIEPQLAEAFVRDASKAVAVLEAICEKRGVYNDKDIEMFTINAHGIKSTLANIGELKLSAAASKLERAGREKNTDVMLNETPVFLKKLREIIEKYMPPKEKEGKETEAPDYAYLREKLLIVQKSCLTYDKKTAKAEITELRQKTWLPPIKELIGTIAEHLLHSDFEEAANVAGEILKTIHNE